MKNIFISLVFVLLTGCATGYDVNLNKSDNEAIKNGQENSAWIVDSKTEVHSVANDSSSASTESTVDSSVEEVQ